MTTESQTEQAPEDTQLTLADLTAMKTIIDISSQRGAFRPNEMVVVGQTYNKLVTFLQQAKQQGETK